MKTTSRIHSLMVLAIFIGICAGCCNRSDGNTLTNGLLVHLTFDDNYNDDSGNQINGAPRGNPQFVPGFVGSGAVSLTTLSDGGEFDYVTLGYPSPLQFDGAASFSVSFWTSFTNQTGDPPFISNKNWNTSANPGWGIFTQPGGNLRVNVTDQSGSADVESTTNTPVIRDGKWHHIAVTFDRTTNEVVTIYVDGRLMDTNSLDAVKGDIDTVSSNLNINIGQDGTGSYTDDGEAQMVGLMIDDLGIWNRVLSASEINTVYQGGLAGSNILQAASSPALTSAPLYGINLIVNGDAEAGPPDSDADAIVPAPGWENTTGTFTVCEYGAVDLNSGQAVIAQTDPGPANRGLSFFSGGYNGASSSASQTIDVSAGAGAIDATNVTFYLDGWFGGWSTQDDNATLTATFLSGAGVTLGSVTIGGVLAADRTNITSMLERNTNGFVPPGTRTIVLQQIMTRITGTYNDGYADNLLLMLNLVNTPPSITQQPISITTDPGSTITFTVTAAGTQPLAYQWEFNGTNVPEATSAALTLSNVQTNQVGAYIVIVTNIAGSTTSSNAFLSLNTPPAFTRQPISVITNQSAAVTFTVGAPGAPALSYQWQFNDVPIPGATESSLTLASTVTTNIGDYSVVVSNVAGTATSSDATLTFFDLKMYAGLTITSSVATNYGVQSIPAVDETNWTTLTNITVGTEPYLYIDYDSFTNTMRFYRLVLP